MEHYFCIVLEYASAMVLAGLLKDIFEFMLEEEED